MHFDLNIIYASRFVSLIGSQLNLWISELERISTVALAEKINDDQNSKDKDEDVSSIRMPGARQTCKNILRLNKVAFERMQACRVYVVDAAMPLRFISLVLNYVAVIIQIALGRK
ncbi:jg17826 [Pararge aegeria aegeria]|uniref:Jg17826 protein n=1 Tax=Pararge aegeria aegeria TaxID=348720 RepID=A0A8S4SKI0_9NEOP|nr:jg17826 [Pararge aegeria aegeria]